MFGVEFLPQNLASDVALLDSMWKRAKRYLHKTLDFVLVPASPRKKASVEALLGAYMLRQRMPHIQFVPTLSGGGCVGEAGKIRLKAELLGVQYAGFDTIALIGGEDGGINGIELISLAREILGEKVRIISGSGTLTDKASRERLEKKLKAGADKIITQPLFSAQEAQVFLQHFESIAQSGGYEVEAFIGVFGIFHLESVRRINEANLGFKIPQAYIDAMVSGKQNEGDKHIGRSASETLWQEICEVAQKHNASLYLSTPKHNDLRVYGKFKV